MLKVVDVKNKQLEEAKATADEKAKLVEAKEAEIKRAKDPAERNEVLNSLVGSLNKDLKK